MNILSPAFLFNTPYDALQKADTVILGIALLFIVLAVIFKVAAVLTSVPVDKKYRNKGFSLLLTIGLLELVWYGARYEQVRFIGTRIVAFFILVVGAISVVRTVITAVKSYSQEKEVYDKEQVKLKYLPK